MKTSPADMQIEPAHKSTVPAAMPQSAPTASVAADPAVSEVGRNDTSQWAILAALRFMLAVIVCCNHYYFVAPFERAMPLPLYLLRLMGGATAVVGFFLLSGYSISASIARDAKQYASRRVWRIYPVYLFCAFYALTPYFIAGGEFSLLDGSYIPWPSYATLLMSFLALPYLFTKGVAAVNVAWSLTCEIIYYAVAPLLNRLRMGMLAGVGGISLAVYAWLTHFKDPLDVHMLGGIVPLAMAWFWILAFGFYRYRSAKYAAVLFVALPLALYVMYPAELFGHITILLVALGIVVAPSIKLSAAAMRIANFLGDISYPLYLSHLTTLWSMYLIWPHWMQTHSSLYLIAALAVAVVITIGFDYPMRRIAKIRIKNAERREAHKYPPVTT